MLRAEARPIRTLLFVPGNDEKKVATCLEHGADAIMLDIEEPRTPFPESERERARALVREFLDDLPGGQDQPLVFARVHPVASGAMLRDLTAVLHPRLFGVLLPKIDDATDVHGAQAVLTCMELEAGLERGSTSLYPVLETAQALRQAYEIAMASPRILYMGGAISRFGDLHQAIRYRWTAKGDETLYLRSKVLIDAKAAGIRYPISGMWGGRLDDRDGLEAWCRQLRNMGYFGMMVTHPSQVGVVNELFSPTTEEIAYWKDLDRLATAAEADGTQVIYGDESQGEGHIVHTAHVGSARLNLTWARDLGLAY